MAILGPSGVGKTTILRLLAGGILPDEGKIILGAKKLGYVFQEPRLFPWRTALSNITFVLKGNKNISSKERDKMGREMLELLGLKGYENFYPSQLSGGMRQKVAIGRAFVVKPDLLLMDEPFTGLDLELKLSLQKMLIDLLIWHSTTIIFVTHDPQDAVRLADDVLILSGRPGKIAVQFSLDLPREKRDSEYLHKYTMKLTEYLIGESLWNQQNTYSKF